jgi:hypothetical protein
MDIAGDSISKPLLSVAFHPSGYYLAIGFIDKVRIFHVLYDELRIYREVNVRNANILKFSNGGHYLAAGSGKIVYIYSTYSLELVQTLKNHINNISDMAWGRKDITFVSVGTDGKYNEYATRNWHLDKSREVQNTTFTSVVMTNKESLVYGEDPTNCKIFESHGEEWQAKILAARSSIANYTFFFTPNGFPMLIAGTKRGNINILSSTYETVEDTVAHLGSVTQVRSSPDGRYLFSAGEDGTIFIYTVVEPTDFTLMDREMEAKDDQVTQIDEQLADIVLIKKTELDEFKSA